MTQRRKAWLLSAFAALLLLSFFLVRDPREFARRHGGKQRLSVATGPVGGVYYVYGGAIAKVISAHVRNVEATAEVTAASVDNLKFLSAGKADLALTLANTLYDAHAGVGQFERATRAPARALAVLYTGYLQAVTFEDRDVSQIRDLRGKVVAIGGPGSGTATIAPLILRAAGLNPGSDVRIEHLGLSHAADALKDRKIDAFFWVSGVPAGPILDLASTPGRQLRLLPSAELLPALRRDAGNSFFTAEIPAGSYRGIAQAVKVVAVANVLVVDEATNEQLAYEITRVLFERRSELIAVHPEARHLAVETAIIGSPVAFHPGAIRYYRERAAWRD